MLSAVVMVALVAAIYVPSLIQMPGASSSVITSDSSLASTETTATSCTTSNATSTSTTSSSTSTSTTTTSSTSTVTVTNTSSTSPANVTYGSLTYSPTSPVKIESVEAITSQAQDGSIHVTFQVLFVNTGTAPIYVIGGCGGGLSSSIAGNYSYSAGGSSVIQKIVGGPLCDCAVILLSIGNGENHTSANPGCWSGYNYVLVGSGAVDMNFTLQWSTDSQHAFQGTNSTSISAVFDFGSSMPSDMGN
jgi:hypothetical protein